MRGNQNVAATTKKRSAAWQADQLHGNDIPCRIHHAVLASISLIYSSQNQISYFMDDMGKVADYNFSMMKITKKRCTENQSLYESKRH